MTNATSEQTFSERKQLRERARRDMTPVGIRDRRKLPEEKLRSFCPSDAVLRV